MAKTTTQTLSPRRLRRRERNRDALRQAARTVFERRGYVDTTIQDIIDEADIGRGTFYSYFNSKDDIFADLVQWLVDEFVTTGTEIGDVRSVRKRLHISIGGMLKVAKKNRGLLAAVNQAIHVSEDHAKRWGQMRTRLEAVIARDLEWCKRREMINDVDTKILALLLAGMVESATRECAARSSLSASQVEQVLVDTYWNAVFRPHEGAEDYTF